MGNTYIKTLSLPEIQKGTQINNENDFLKRFIMVNFKPENNNLITLTFNIFYKETYGIQFDYSSNLTKVVNVIKQELSIDYQNGRPQEHNFKYYSPQQGFLDLDEDQPFAPFNSEEDILIMFDLLVFPNILNQPDKQSNLTLVGKPHFQDELNKFVITITGLNLGNSLQPNFDIIIPPQNMNNMNLDKISASSAFCNGNNHLYISGGSYTKGGNPTHYFWDIDLEKYLENKQNINKYCSEYEMPIGYKNHSMIFIPNQYVFILGGKEKNVIVFDIISKQFLVWHSLNSNQILIKPTLVLVKGRYLCCFLFKKNNQNPEICPVYYADLRSNSQWITTKLISQIPQQGIFSVCPYNENKLVFIKNKDSTNNNPTFYVDLSNFPDKNPILELNPLTTNGLEKSYLFDDLNFIKLSENIFGIMPKCTRQCPEFLYFDGNNFKSFSKMIDINYNSFNKKNKHRVPLELGEALNKAEKISVNRGVNRVNQSGAFMPPINKDSSIKGSTNKPFKNIEYNKTYNEDEPIGRNCHNNNQSTGIINKIFIENDYTNTNSKNNQKGKKQGEMLMNNEIAKPVFSIVNADEEEEEGREIGGNNIRKSKVKLSIFESNKDYNSSKKNVDEGSNVGKYYLSANSKKNQHGFQFDGNMKKSSIVSGGSETGKKSVIPQVNRSPMKTSGINDINSSSNLKISRKFIPHADRLHASFNAGIGGKRRCASQSQKDIF